MYEEYQSSWMTVKDWCEAQGISVKTFYYRLRVLRENLLKETKAHEIVAIAACENTLPIGRVTQPDERIHITVNGIKVELHMSVSPELMTAIFTEDN